MALPRRDASWWEKADLPLITGEGKDVRLIAGSMYGERSPVLTFSDMVYADCALGTGAALPVDAER